MSNTKPLSDSLDFRAIVDGLGQGVLIFDSDDRLVMDNVAARTILGANLVLSSAERAAAVLFDLGPTSAHRRRFAEGARRRSCAPHLPPAPYAVLGHRHLWF
jgi:PAS domain-containing protein